MAKPYIMRNIFLAAVVILSVASFNSCKKNNNTDPGYAELQGDWELITRTGGIVGDSVKFSFGNGNTYSFKNDTYTKLTPQQMSKTGIYKVTRDSSSITRQPTTRIIFDNNQTAVKTLIRFGNLRMFITEDVVDGFTYEYRKVLSF